MVKSARILMNVHNEVISALIMQCATTTRPTTVVTVKMDLLEMECYLPDAMILLEYSKLHFTFLLYSGLHFTYILVIMKCNFFKDECKGKTDECNREREDCWNNVGSYFCNCKKGYYRYETLDVSVCIDLDECIGDEPPCDERQKFC